MFPDIFVDCRAVIVIQRSKKIRVARPEVSDGRLWMPYAREDRVLSDTRRLEWVKLSIRADAFEETEEPPLIDNGKR